ncbi:MAG: hypothetical protein H6702_20515 [Myxococcales bacterium]|nr:hypothetical protein [Myxococcales bacterium]
MKRWYWGVALAALSIGCDDSGGTAADAGMAINLDSGMVGGGDPLQAFCARTARAKCDWAFGCLTPGAIRGTFGFEGGDADACTAAETAACFADVSARQARGTLDFSEDAVDRCVKKLEDAPCLPGDPADWVRDWYQFTGTTCNSVTRGNVPQDGACTVRTDCQNPDHICGDGVCRQARAADIMQQCGSEVRSQGTLLSDESCAGEVCLALGNNAQEVFGTCTADCRYGTGCPSGAYCLQLQALGSTPSWFCTWPCADDRDCAAGLTCTPVNDDDPNTKHCYITPPE